MTQHTPGPWEVEKEYSGDEIWIKTESEIIVCAVWPLSAENPHEEKEVVNNAHLISAAPDLLEALEYFIHDLRTPGSPLTKEGRASRLEMAEKAIAKAKGES